MRRREYLAALAATSLTAGCSGETGSAAATSTASDAIRANYEPIADHAHHFVEYSLSAATLVVDPSALSTSFPDGAKVALVATHYPYGGVVAEATSETFDVGDDRRTVSLKLGFDPGAFGDASHYVALALPADATIDDAGEAAVEKLCETDRFRVENGRLRRDRHESTQPELRKSNYERIPGEGVYLLRFSGVSLGTSWETSFTVFKGAYAKASDKPHTRSIPEHVAYALEQGYAESMASLLSSEAKEAGFSTKRKRTEFAIDFVQNLPYVPDEVSTGFDDYSKYVAETLVEGGGDCEDSSILLASVLQSAPFGYDCVLIFPPGHAAVGVYAADSIPGAHYDYRGRPYYYLETTGEGWGVGDAPEQYRQTDARIYDI